MLDSETLAILVSMLENSRFLVLWIFLSGSYGGISVLKELLLLSVEQVLLRIFVVTCARMVLGFVLLFEITVERLSL